MNFYFYTKREIRKIDNYIEKQFNPFREVLCELGTREFKCDVVIIPPSEKQPFYKLVTCGAGAYIMTVPDELKKDHIERAEYVMFLPENWDFKSNKKEFTWAVEYLKKIAYMPKLTNSFFAYGHTITANSDFSPVAPGTQLNSFILVRAINKDGKLVEPVKINLFERVNFYQVIPLYQEELDFKLQTSLNDFLDLFQKENVDFTIDPHRKNCCEAKRTVGTEQNISKGMNEFGEAKLKTVRKGMSVSEEAERTVGTEQNDYAFENDFVDRRYNDFLKSEIYDFLNRIVGNYINSHYSRPAPVPVKAAVPEISKISEKQENSPLFQDKDEENPVNNEPVQKGLYQVHTKAREEARLKAEKTDYSEIRGGLFQVRRDIDEREKARLDARFEKFYAPLVKGYEKWPPEIETKNEPEIKSVPKQVPPVQKKYVPLVPSQIEDFVKSNLDSSFSDKLLRLIREKNLDEVEVYKKADIDRRHFSKIRSNSAYQPKKDTVVLLCLSMELNLTETEDLLKSAGLSLSNSDKKDLITRFFLENQLYDIFMYKAMLNKFCPD